MILKNEKIGVRPFFENLRLRPGKPIEGKVVTPDGNPAVGVKICAFCADPISKKDREPFGDFTWTATDATGRFRLDLYPSGPAFLSVLPTQYALSTHILKKDERGDLGTITLKPGNTIRGQVFDAKGKPVAGVYVQASREGITDFAEIAEFKFVGDSIGRAVLTSEDGAFTINGLPDGTYQVQPVEQGLDPATREDIQDMACRPLPGAFTMSKVTLKNDEPTELLVIRAVPHVVVEAQNYISKGEKRGHSECWISGRIDGGYWHAQIYPRPDGTYHILAPHGLERTRIELPVGVQSAIQVRTSSDAPLQSPQNVRLGTLDHDVKGIEIIRYEAPILIIKATGTDGRPVKGFKASLWYTEGGRERTGGFRLKSGVSSEVNLYEHPGGGYRTVSLVPEREVKVTVQAEGFKSASRTLKLSEGKTEEVTLVMEPQ
jgi:hypothetical protein